MLKEKSGLWTLPAVAHYLSLSLNSVRALVAAGELKRVQIGRSVRVTEASVSEFIAKGGVK